MRLERADPMRPTHDLSNRQPSRRAILGWSAAALAQLWASSFFSPRPAAASTTVAEHPWGRVDRLSDGVWAVVSTPLASNDFTTVCNGGIVAGADRTLLIESFAREEGAAALAEIARELTGRWPTDVVVTHFHADHTGGLGGLRSEGRAPRLWITEKTRELVRAEDAQREVPGAEARAEMLDSARTVDIGLTTEVELGGVRVVLQPRSGHTPSDLTVRVGEPGVLFAGDLVWNGLFPNYRDALPRRLATTVEALRSEPVETFVSGHGAIADRKAFGLYAAVVEDIGAAARRAIEKGVTAKAAAAEYELPKAAAEWVLFNPAYFEVAIDSWMREAESG